MQGPMARPSRPSVRLTALDEATITKTPNGIDKKKTRTDEAWVRLYARFETDCLLPADAEHASATHRRLYRCV